MEHTTNKTKFWYSPLKNHVLKRVFFYTINVGFNGVPLFSWMVYSGTSYQNTSYQNR
jgi:hypothetical protein